MLRHDRIVTPEIAKTLARLEVMEDLPLCCERSTLHGVRVTWVRWHAIMLQVIAGSLDGIWVVSPWNAPVRFDSTSACGFVVCSTDPETCAVNVYGHEGQWNDEAQAALVALRNDLAMRVDARVELRQPTLDMAREAVQRGIFAHRGVMAMKLIEAPITRASEIGKQDPKRGRPRTRV